VREALLRIARGAAPHGPDAVPAVVSQGEALYPRTAVGISIHISSVRIISVQEVRWNRFRVAPIDCIGPEWVVETEPDWTARLILMPRDGADVPVVS
jgi:hypothetical protein